MSENTDGSTTPSEIIRRKPADQRHDVRLLVRVRREDGSRLDAIAEEIGISKSKLTNHLLDEFFKNYDRAPDRYTKWSRTK